MWANSSGVQCIVGVLSPLWWGVYRGLSVWMNRKPLVRLIRIDRCWLISADWTWRITWLMLRSTWPGYSCGDSVMKKMMMETDVSVWWCQCVMSDPNFGGGLMMVMHVERDNFLSQNHVIRSHGGLQIHIHPHLVSEPKQLQQNRFHGIQA